MRNKTMQVRIKYPIHPHNMYEGEYKPYTEITTKIIVIVREDNSFQEFSL